MPNITTCTYCGKLYEAGSEEQANEPDRACRACRTGIIENRELIANTVKAMSDVLDYSHDCRFEQEPMDQPCPRKVRLDELLTEVKKKAGL